MRKYIAIAVLVLHSLGAVSQIRLPGRNEAEIAGDLYKGRWPAEWISPDGSDTNTYTVCHFRKSFNLDSLPSRFVVHVSADNRYKLYVNGEFAGTGPSGSDIYNWNFETLDISPYLVQGENTIAAVVWNFADKRPVAQMTFGKTGFILQGNSAIERGADTGSSWLCLRNDAYSPYERPVLGYYAAGACELFDASAYPWGWYLPDYDDSSWEHAVPLIEGAMKGSMDYPGWQLVPDPLRQPSVSEVCRIPVLRRAVGADVPEGFPMERERVTIPPYTEAEILLDNKELQAGYMSLVFSGGEGSEIEVGYAESLFESRNVGDKGNRDAVDDKHFIGYADKILPDGGYRREYTTLWWRTWRYIRLKVVTGKTPLHIDDIYSVASAYPFIKESVFCAPGLDRADDILETGWRTARLCAHDTYMDCPYYEQLQYFGDTRIQAMVTMYNTRNDEMVLNALEMGRRSIVADGMTMSRYPASLHQFIPSFSLIWICMGHDYWMYRGNEGYLKSLLPAFRSVLGWTEAYFKENGSLGYVPYWFFMDWCGSPDGEPVREDDGDSGFQDLLYLLALDAASEMEDAFGSKAVSKHYRELSQRIRKSFYGKYRDVERGLFADTGDHRSFSQHVNVLAILAGIVTGDDARNLLDRVISDKSLLQCSIYFRYYLNLAMKAAGCGDLFIDSLDLWRRQLDLGLSTWAEQPEPSRSDCHAWGSSPNIEFFRIILGIDSAAPGFSEVRIAPSLGELTSVSGTMPHPQGEITADYSISGKGDLKAVISLPRDVSGTFIWKGCRRKLSGGENIIVFTGR